MASQARVIYSLTEQELLDLINRLQGTSFVSLADWQDVHQDLLGVQADQTARIDALEQQIAALLSQQSSLASNTVALTIT